MLHYNSESNNSICRIVAFEVRARSVKMSVKNVTAGDTCTIGEKPEPLELPESGSVDVTFTYEVEFKQSEVRWASRWDTYLAMADLNIHWFSIINSVIVVLFLAGILTMIIVRTLRRDIAKYNKLEDDEEAMEESGWKLVHGDVFRPPVRPRLLAALTGAGIQILSATFIVIVFAMLGMLSPASRGALVTAAVFLFVFMGIVAGYYSARLYKTLRGYEWKKAALMTAMLYPAVICGTCFVLNLLILAKQSSGAVPFTTMLALLCMWIGISLPLVFIGYFFGFRKQPYEHPVRVNQIVRMIPDQVWYLNPVIATAMAGILPFGAMFIELFFIFNAIWENQFYYLFGFLFVVFLILVISCSQISIVMTYFQLCNEDYLWWWRSFIVSGGSAFYIFIYSVFYFFTKLEITELIPALLYFGYSSLMAFTIWLLTGTIGFYAAYFFVSKIYGAIKID
jgi:transmembrane 9 superfamily protein 2/4